MKKDIRLINLDTESDEFIFNWSSKNGTVTGRDKLVQTVAKRILTAKGSNQFHPQLGGSFYNLFRAVDFAKEQQVKEAFPVMLKDIEESIIAEQAQDTSLKPQEKLRALNLINIDLDEVFGAWVVKIEVVTQDGVINKFSVN